MNDDEIPQRRGPDDPEGVRIIGADEAEAALERDDVARRRAPDEPRPGDRPGGPPADAPEPVLRFPLSSTDADAEAAPDLPHWSDPPTGQYGAVGGGLFEDDIEAGQSADWSSITGSTPRWRDSDESWSEDEDVRNLGDDDAPMGALDESDRPDPEDFFSFDELDTPAPGRSVFAGDAAGDELDYEYDPDHDPGYDEGPYEGDDDSWPVDDDPSGPRKIVVGGGRVTPGNPPRTRIRPPEVPGAGAGVGGDRDIGQAAIVGVGFLAVAGLLFFLGPATAALLVIAVVTLASAEFFTKVREVGYQPAVLLGIVGTLGMTLGAYHRGETAIPVAMVLVVGFSMLWFLAGAGNGQATLNIGITLLGVGWIGMFGSFATSILSIGDSGTGILFGAIVATVGYDVGGYFVGRSAGRSPLSEASPNKTIEGLVGGCIAALTVAVIYGFLAEPFGSLGDGLALGITVAIAAPLGDLCQSMIKRDLGIKDMGAVLPGHGGFMDRFDALLFVLPCVYYVAKLSDFFI